MVQKKPYKLSVVIPVYKSEEILKELTAQLVNILDITDDLKTRYEIIFVCDCSPDNSWKMIDTLAIEYSQVQGILLRMNVGQHNALMAGLSHAKGEIIVTMDDDLQHSPADIPLLLTQIKQGSDVAYARFKKRNHALWKTLGSHLNNIMVGYLMKKPRGLYLSPFRAIKSVIRDEITRYRGPYVYVDGLILSVTRNIAGVDVNHHERYTGDSGYSLRKSISLWLKMATNFSIVPLRVISLFGMLFSGFGFFLAILLVIQKFTLNLMPIGWTSLIISILIIGGVQLLAIGMLGEYLGRVLLTINSQPQYVIATIIGSTTLLENS